MPNIRFDRDPKDPVPEGLNEAEQQAVMLKAVKQRGGLGKGEELTAVPSGSPPLPGGWISVGTVSAPTGKSYRVYMKFPGGHGHGPLGTRHNKPKGDSGTMARTQHKPNKITGLPPEPPPTEEPKPIETPPQKAWLGSVESDRVGEVTADLKNLLEDPGATEKEITEMLQKAMGVGRQLALLGGEDDPRMQELQEQIGEAMDLLSETANSDFESVLRKESLSKGSQSEKTITEHMQKTLGGLRQKQLMGYDLDDKEYKRSQELIDKAIGVLADRHADHIEEVLKRSKATPSTVSDKEVSDAAREVFAMARSLELMGISRPKAVKALSDLDDILLALVARKTEARNALVKERAVPNSSITDADVDRANAELESLKEQIRRLGISVP